MLTPPPAAAAAIIEANNGLLRGLNHALSNRVNTLNTLLAVVEEADGFDPEVVQALAAEEAKFESLLQLYRLMPMELRAAPEPILLADPLRDATALFSHHLDLRMHPVAVVGVDEAPPVRSRRQMLTQLLLMLLVEVGRSLEAENAATGLEVTAAADGDDVTVTVRATLAAPPAPGDVWLGVEWMTDQLGGRAERGVDADGRVWARLALLSLAAERRKGR